MFRDGNQMLFGPGDDELGEEISCGGMALLISSCVHVPLVDFQTSGCSTSFAGIFNCKMK
jgi:hypothetical protein